MQTLFQELLTKLNQLMTADSQSPLVQAALKNNVLLPDQTCPYLDWDPVQKCLKVGTRRPITLQKMITNIQEMLDMCAEISLIKAFHALPPSSNGAVTPWRLQMSMRADREFTLMESLCGSSIWMLLAVSLKIHSQQQSSQALQLAQLMGLQRPSKGKSKGKPLTH